MSGRRGEDFRSVSCRYGDVKIWQLGVSRGVTLYRDRPLVFTKFQLVEERLRCSELSVDLEHLARRESERTEWIAEELLPQNPIDDHQRCEIVARAKEEVGPGLLPNLPTCSPKLAQTLTTEVTHREHRIG